MTHKALVRRLQISCLGLDRIDPLCLLVDDVIEALRENAMREVQRLGQEIEQEPVKYSDYEPDGVHHNKPQQEPVAYWKEHAQGLQRDYDSLLADFQAQRTWVGLTDEEYKELHLQMGPVYYYQEYGRAIEAKLKDKNDVAQKTNS